MVSCTRNPYILAYGGSIPHPGRELSRSIGKFGVGLSQTASCLSTRTEVYTKNSNDEEWRYGYYDFEELFASDDCTLEPETTKRPPWIDLPETGTIIILDDVDKAKRKERPTWILNELETTLGRVYRRVLNDGRTLTLTEQKKNKVETRHIRPSDPLHQMPQSVEVKRSASEDYSTVTIRFDGSNSCSYLRVTSTIVLLKYAFEWYDWEWRTSEEAWFATINGAGHFEKTP